MRVGLASALAAVLGLATWATPQPASAAVGGTSPSSPAKGKPRSARHHGKHAPKPTPATPTAATGSTSQTGGAALEPTTPHAPITAKTPRLNYTGPVYELAPTGQMTPYVAATTQQALDEGTGGSVVSTTGLTKPRLLVPGRLARLIDGLAAAPMEAPESVKDIVWAGDEIVGLPYIYGGGHASFHSPGYDCSGTVSYALHGAALLSVPEDSSELESFGGHGVGEWVTVFANPGHAYMDVAGLRLDTSAADDPSNQQGPRWRPLRPHNAGYTVRHPLEL